MIRKKIMICVLCSNELSLNIANIIRTLICVFHGYIPTLEILEEFIYVILWMSGLLCRFYSIFDGKSC